MATPGAGDELVDDDQPLTILLVDRPERLTEAGRAFQNRSAALLRFHLCGSLSDALRRLGEEEHDAAILAADLPDSWPADTFARFRSAEPDVPVVLVLENERDLVRFNPGDLAPFCVIRRTRADPRLVRTLAVSACLFGRALRGSPDAQVDFRHLGLMAP